MPEVDAEWHVMPTSRGAPWRRESSRRSFCTIATFGGRLDGAITGTEAVIRLARPDRAPVGKWRK